MARMTKREARELTLTRKAIRRDKYATHKLIVTGTVTR